MTWRQRLRQASFRGVEFQTKESNLGGGRRTANHEYPLRDKNFVDDLGRKKRRFRLRAFVLGDDYFDKRDALRQACESAGPGELVHPYHGTKQVICESFTIRERSERGRMAEFSLDFIETGIRREPRGAVNPGAAVSSESDSLIDAAAADFRDSVLVENVPGFIRDAARTGIQEFGTITDAIQQSGRLVSSTVSQLGINSGARLANNVRTLSNFDAGSILDIDRTVDLVRDTVDTLDALAPDRASAASIMGEIQSLGLDTREEITFGIIRENQNRRAVKDFVETVALSREAKATQQSEFASHSDAIDARDRVTEKIDNKIDNAGDTTFESLRAMRAEFVGAVPPEDESLPRIQKLMTNMPTNSLLASYQQYGTAERAAEVETRNKTRHPGFMDGDLEVVSV